MNYIPSLVLRKESRGSQELASTSNRSVCRTMHCPARPYPERQQPSRASVDFYERLDSQDEYQLYFLLFQLNCGERFLSKGPARRRFEDEPTVTKGISRGAMLSEAMNAQNRVEQTKICRIVPYRDWIHQHLNPRMCGLEGRSAHAINRYTARYTTLEDPLGYGSHIREQLPYQRRWSLDALKKAVRRIEKKVGMRDGPYIFHVFHSFVGLYFCSSCFLRISSVFSIYLDSSFFTSFLIISPDVAYSLLDLFTGTPNVDW